MSYKILYRKSAGKELVNLPRKTAIRIRDKIIALCENPRPPQSKKLSRSMNLYRIRVSNYRIIYSVEDKIKIVKIVKIGHRKNVYKFIRI